MFQSRYAPELASLSIDRVPSLAPSFVLVLKLAFSDTVVPCPFRSQSDLVFCTSKTLCLGRVRLMALCGRDHSSSTVLLCLLLQRGIGEWHRRVHIVLLFRCVFPFLSPLSKWLHSHLLSTALLPCLSLYCSRVYGPVLGLRCH